MSGLYSGLVMGAMYFFLFGLYALGFAYGVFLISDPTSGYTIGKVTLVVWSVIEGTYAFSTSVSAIQGFATSRFAAYRVFQITDRCPEIDPYSEAGTKLDKATFTSRIEFKDVAFAYPTRHDVPVLKGVSFKIEPGTTVAFVGASGCGKSTVIQLRQRYYDPDCGNVLIDGHDLRRYNITSFRGLVGSVNQEPGLFATTIFENIRYGSPDATKDAIENAAKLANAHDFVTKLPMGYDTMVGEQGAQLSGGQKQRIAIARSLVRDPRFLLLDEATSALDTESEAVVQDALDRARSGRTTIAIAHRLSTIMNADKIIILDGGKVCEVGTHGELIAKQGMYAKLVEAQQGRGGPTEINLNGIQQRRAALVTKTKMKAKHEAAEDNSVDEDSQMRSKTLSVRKKIDAEFTKQHYSSLRLWKLAAKEIPFYLIGSVGAIICGCAWPSFSIVVPRVIHAYSVCPPEDPFDQAMKFSLILVGLGGGFMLGFIIMLSLFAYAGERVVLRARKLAFRAMLRQDMAWFDDPENSPGALTSHLGTQATALKDATGAQLGQIVQVVTGLIASFAVAFAHDWRITLIMLGFAPLAIMSGLITAMIFGDNKTSSLRKPRMRLQLPRAISEQLHPLVVTTSFSIFSMYPSRSDTRSSSLNSSQVNHSEIVAICFGFYETVYNQAYAAGYYAASVFIRWGVTDFEKFMTALLSIMFSGYFIGQANAMTPDQAKAHLRVAQIFKLLDRKPEIQWEEEPNLPNNAKSDHCDGNAQFSSIEFHYPTRKSVQILRGLNLSVHSGQTVALVGASGCGKSTVIQLFERFYDPTCGDVFLDENRLPALNLPWARSKMALVQQEPILFDRTIAENIAYGAVSPVSEAQIETAARMANIHSFITSLPDGYNTRVGQRGGKLSGGQKQRIAIARALVRQPKFLLLDEATSALVSESERVVQEALDQARTGRTVLVIAHRLSTIENADVIAVVKGGMVGEIGKHNELLAKKGTYYNLWSAQQLSASP